MPDVLHKFSIMNFIIKKVLVFRKKITVKADNAV